MRNAVFAGLEKYPVPGQDMIKGSKRELHQKRNTITSRYATLDTLRQLITTAISLTGKLDFLLHQNLGSKCLSTSLQE